MKLLICLLFFLAAAPSWAATYYLSATGSDSNNGTSTSVPWLTPNHAVNCGDIITAASGSSYTASNFASGKWGTVTCSAGGVAWLKCATFDACKISASGQSGMQISSPYWGVQGWEISTGSPGYACFNVQPSSGQSVHHIIFANDVCNSAYGGGFQVDGDASSSIADYIALIGDIAYNAAQGSDACHSGLTIGFIKQLDANAGTHIIVAGNYAWDNYDHEPCAGSQTTDGEGMELDTLDQFNYSGQVLMENNIFVGNGGRGININNNNCGGATPCTAYATVYVKNNTTYGNNQQVGQSFPSGLGEIEMTNVNGVTSSANLAMTSTGTIGGNAIYAYAWNPVGTANSVAGNWLYSAAGNTTFGSGYGSNTTGTNPAFHSATIPGAPTCSGTTNTLACAATLIADFTPTASGTSTYGYQAPGASVTDPLFPTWLCSGTSLIAGFPAGLITPGCGASGAPTLIGIAISGTAAVAKGSTTALTATGSYSNSTTQNLTSASTWVSSSTSICTVFAGVVTGVANGTCSITAADSGVTSPGYTVTVGAPVLVSLAITGASSLVAGGPGSQLVGTGTYSDGSTQLITFQSIWSSSNTAVCTVTSSGALVTPVAVGTCVITAVNGAITNSPTFTVTVGAATLSKVSVTSNNGSNTVTVGSTQQFTATGTYTNGSTQNVTTGSSWTESGGSHCTVSSTGLVTGVTAGTCLITATYQGHSNTPALGVQAVVPGSGTSILEGITIIGALVQ